MERKIIETGEFDGKSVLGCLGDFGIGNAMAKDEAQAAIFARRISIRDAQTKKGCKYVAPGEPAETTDTADLSEFSTGDIVLIEFNNGSKHQMTITHVTEKTFNGYYSGIGEPQMTSRTFDKSQIKSLTILKKAQ
ncbi:MAG: hypothetical protein RQ754_06755 [Desulfuromonadales bacterium]|nr:hypothetical protein [Desulfuromonadales bacterium]